MIELSTIRDLITIFGVIAGFSYYVLTVSNQNKSRKAQLLLAISNDISSHEGWGRNVELSYMDWVDYDDFEKKYGSDNNPKAYVQRITMWHWMNNLGIILKSGLIDEQMTYDFLGSSIIISWDKWKPIIEEQRVRYMGENWMEHYEYLSNKMKAVQRERNILWEPPKTGLKYISDK